MDTQVILLPEKPEPQCMYCGGPVKKSRKGEHVIPEAIGGAVYLSEMSDNHVCTGCNNGVLSDIDRELCSRSFLSGVASQELAAHLWQAWDVDHSARNMLLEARPYWNADHSLKALVCYPQITFRPNGVDFRGDADEVEQFGFDDFETILKKAASSAYRRYRAGKRGLVFEQIRSGAVRNGYLLPPRVFSARTVSELARKIDKSTFCLRYVSDADKELALGKLATLRNEARSTQRKRFLGSYTPTISFFYDNTYTLRGLLKIAMNLVAALANATLINASTCREVIGVIRGEAQVTPRLLDSQGFIRPDGIQGIAASEKAHSFLVTYGGGEWHVYSSFFGGRMGSYVHFPGPCNESWAAATVIAPLRSNDWKIQKSRIAQPLKVRFARPTSNEIAPSMNFSRTVSETQVTVEKRTRRTTRS